MPPRVIHNLEELQSLAGTEVGVSDWIVVSQERISEFAETTDDRQWIHLDQARCKAESPFGGPIAHGFLTLSLISSMARQILKYGGEFKMVVNYGLNRVRFPAPVAAGSKVRGRFTLGSVEVHEWGAQLIWNVVVESSEGGKPRLVAEWVTRVYL